MISRQKILHGVALSGTVPYSRIDENLALKLPSLGADSIEFRKLQSIGPEQLLLNPAMAEAHQDIGRILHEQGKLDEAIVHFRRALELKPDLAEAYFYLGNVYSHQWNVDQAIACYSRALDLKPDSPEIRLNLGGMFKEQGRLDEAIACYHQAADQRPDFAEAQSNVLYTLIFHADYDSASIIAGHRRWSQRFEPPLKQMIRPHLNDRSADRCLRIGYISPDFRDHVVGRNLIPLFREHDRQRFEVHCQN